MSQEGTGLTTILEQDHYEQIDYRPFPVNRLNRNVGERQIVGISQIFNKNMVNVDSRQRFTRDDKRFFGKGNQDTARLGQSTGLPDRRDVGQVGGRSIANQLIRKTGRAVKAVGKTAKHVGKQLGHDVVKAGKVIGKEAVKVGKFVKDKKIISKGLKVAGIIAPFVPIPGAAGFAPGLLAGSKVADTVGFGAGRVAEARAEVMRDGRGVRGNERQSFVPSHPMNFNKARLDKL